MTVICKKCLIGQQAEDYLAMLEKCRRAIPERDLAGEAELARRIALCEACEKRSGPTCLACGCYVELRAMKKAVHCPYKKW